MAKGETGDDIIIDRIGGAIFIQELYEFLINTMSKIMKLNEMVLGENPHLLIFIENFQCSSSLSKCDIRIGDSIYERGEKF